MDKQYQAAYQKAVEGNKLVGALATNNAMDRDGDIIDPKGIDLENFTKNPVLLWSHEHGGLPIGKVTDIRRSDDGIEFDAEFSESNPFAQTVLGLFKEGILNAFSIGFIPKERKNETITSAELVEISAVNIPSNPMALLSRSYKSFQKTLDDLDKKAPEDMPEEKPKEDNTLGMMMEHMDMMKAEIMDAMNQHIQEIKEMVSEMMPEEDEPIEEDVPMKSKKENKKQKLIKALKKINN